jgi:hypothetical protein
MLEFSRTSEYQEANALGARPGRVMTVARLLSFSGSQYTGLGSGRPKAAISRTAPVRRLFSGTEVIFGRSGKAFDAAGKVILVDELERKY